MSAFTRDPTQMKTTSSLLVNAYPTYWKELPPHGLVWTRQEYRKDCATVVYHHPHGWLWCWLLRSWIPHAEAIGRWPVFEKSVFWMKVLWSNNWVCRVHQRGGLCIQNAWICWNGRGENGRNGRGQYCRPPCADVGPGLPEHQQGGFHFPGCASTHPQAIWHQEDAGTIASAGVRVGQYSGPLLSDICSMPLYGVHVLKK